MTGSQSPVRTSLLASGAGLVLLSQWIVQRLPFELRERILWAGAAGLILFVAGLLGIRNGETPNRVERALARAADWLRVKDWQVVLLIAAPLYSLAAAIAAGEGPLMFSLGAALAGWFLAIGLALAGGALERVEIPKYNRRALVWIIILTALAFVVRGLFTDRVPVFLTGDEGSAGINSAAFVRGALNNVFVAGWNGFPTFYFFLQSLSIRIFGQTTEALRLPSALAGALTVTTVYYAGASMFDRRVGLLSAIFLLTQHAHIHFSRIGLQNIWDGLWYTLFVWSAWYGWTKDKRAGFLLAGFIFGLSQYFYISGRSMALLFGLWLAIAFFMDRDRLKRYLPHLLVMAAVAFVTILPLGWFFVHHPFDYMAPFNRVSLLGPWLRNESLATGIPAWQLVGKQIGLGFQAYTYTPLRAWYEPAAPLLQPFAASFFLLGLLLLTLRGRDHRFILLALWAVVFGLVGGMSESTPAAQRYVAVIPACALVAGFGLGEIASLLEKLWPQGVRWLTALAVLACAVAGVKELGFYFYEFTPKFITDQAHNNGVVAQRLAEYLQRQPAETTVVFLGQPAMGYYSIPSLQYLAPDITGIDIFLPWGAPENPPVEGSRLLFVFLPPQESQIVPVQSSFPGGNIIIEPAVDGTVLYWLYEYDAN
jgi:4-amino-4-deoxy-L-arabinose transferase-like glycosyltransferase